jgi:hypothetical protein
MNKINNLLKQYLNSTKHINDFLENIESTDIGETPISSPQETKKDKEKDEEGDK